MNISNFQSRLTHPRLRDRTIVLASLLALSGAWTSKAACTLLWGHSPTIECLWHAEFAKEGLEVDASGRSFSVGYGQPGNNSIPKVGVLQVRNASGAKLSQSYYANGPFSALYAGVWVPNAGQAAFAVGTQYTGNSANPTEMIITRWLPGGGLPWTSPVNAQTASYTPAQLGLLGTEAWGCRVVKIGATDLFVTGCTEFEIFLARLNRNTLALVTSWGTGGVQSVASLQPNGCPPHSMPGGFVDFAFHRQSFVEIVGNTVYLGGTLLNDLPGVAVDYDYVVAAYDRNTGAPKLPFGIQYSRALKDEYMKALSATFTGVYACGTSDPNGSPRMLLVAWHNDGSLRPPFYVFEPTPSLGNDVETRLTAQGCEIYVGGGAAMVGATWRYIHALPSGSPVSLPGLWNGAGSGPNPKPYGPAAALLDEVYDLGLGTGAKAGHVFATGGALLSPGNYGQNLQCIPPNGLFTFSNNATPFAPGDDRGTAVSYHPASGGTVFTHGTAFDPGPSTWLACPIHWAYRSSRYLP